MCFVKFLGRILIFIFSDIIHSQILTAKHWTEVWGSHETVRGRIEDDEGDGDPIGRTTVSTNPDPWELPETKPPTKEHTWRGPRPSGTYVAEDCLVWLQ